MAVSATSSARLGCGREIDQVWESIDDPPDEHERTCPDCTRARASLTRLRDLTAEQRSSDLTEPELQPGPQVLTRIMAVARAEVRRAHRLPLDEPEADQLVSDLTVSEQTVSAVARRAGDAVAGAQVRRCRVELVTAASAPPSVSGRGPSAPVVDVGPAVAIDRDAPLPDSLRTSRPSRVAVFLQISVAATAAIPAVSQDVREAVISAVHSEVGMETVRVEIEVKDVHDV